MYLYLPLKNISDFFSCFLFYERGEFEKGGKSVARNVEVTMLIVEATGQTLKVRP